MYVDEQRDAVVNSDNGSEVHSYLKSVGVKHILYVGAASNMCVLHRQDATTNMKHWGWEVAVVRDEIDAMHSPEDAPYVTHAQANDLMTNYYEQWQCPTVSSHDLDYPVSVTGMYKNDDVDAISVAIDWTTETRRTSTAATVEVDVMPFLARQPQTDPYVTAHHYGGSFEKYYAALKNLNASYVRFAPWCPNPRLVVPELTPPDCTATKPATNWNSSFFDQLMLDFL